MAERGRMRLLFRDPALDELRFGSVPRLKLPPEVVRSYQRKIQALAAAPDERTLRNFKSFHYEKLRGDREGERAIRLNDQWRLVFLLDSVQSEPVITVLCIEDYH